MTENRWLCFDPTIHAGHIITAVTIIVCTAGAWYGIQADIAALKQENVQRKQDINDIKREAIEREKDNDRRFEGMVNAQRQETAKLRDDMNGWFMNLDAKLDRKADKK